MVLWAFVAATLAVAFQVKGVLLHRVVAACFYTIITILKEFFDACV